MISTVQIDLLREVDTHPPFRSTVQHKAFVTDVLYPDLDELKLYVFTSLLQK